MPNNADHQEHVIDDAAHAAHSALHQRFAALKDQLAQIHTRWQHAIAAKDFAR